jgi:hypothetical protein
LSGRLPKSRRVISKVDKSGDASQTSHWFYWRSVVGQGRQVSLGKKSERAACRALLAFGAYR